MDASRRCFRLVGGVLVERTVGDVLPHVKDNMTNITGIVEALKKQLADTQRQSFELQRRLGVAGGPAGGAGGGGAAAAAGGAGVLV